MSLDDTARDVFAMTRPPLGMLVAGRATEMVAASLPEASRARFTALAEALQGWWPRRRRDPEEIHGDELAACLALADEAPSAAMDAAVQGALVQMAALLKTQPRSLPAGPYYDMGADDLVALLRAGAKATRLPLAQLDARLKLLLDRAKKKEKWPALVERTDRMRWDRGEPWGKLDKRVRALASLADLGALVSWSKVGAQDALRLELDGTKRITVLEPEELEALRAVVPSIPDPV